MKISYGALKKNVLKRIEALESVAAQRETGYLADYLAEVKQKLLQGRFNLVVLGEFKRGKTTFLNALLGADLLPTAVVPLTSIVTLIEYGRETSAEVIFLNGDIREIILKELPAYITEEGNPGNGKKVKLVRLTHPSPYLKDGVILIDTPGVGSIYQNNTDETYNYLPKVDAAIFLLSSDQPISRSELDFLKDISRYAAKTFFILNKIDYLNAEDRQKALEFSQKVLMEKVGFEQVNIYPLSAKLALEGNLTGDADKLRASNLHQFTSMLERFLLAEKGRAAINAACNKAANAAGELQLGLELEMRALGIPLEELKAKINVFDEMVINLRQEHEDNNYIFQGEIKKVYRELEEEISGFEKHQNTIVGEKVNQAFLEKKNVYGLQLLNFLRSYINSSIEEAFNDWMPQVEERVKAAFEKVVARFTEKTNRVIGELLKQSAEIFDISVEGFTRVESITEESELYYLIGDRTPLLFPEGIKVSAALLPGFIAKPMILREMKKKIENEIDRNCGRVRTDYNERIIKSAREFKTLFDEKFNSAIEATRLVLTRAIKKREHSEKEAAEVYEKLAGKLTLIKEAKNGLQDIVIQVATDPEEPELQCS